RHSGSQAVRNRSEAPAVRNRSSEDRSATRRTVAEDRDPPSMRRTTAGLTWGFLALTRVGYQAKSGWSFWLRPYQRAEPMTSALPSGRKANWQAFFMVFVPT